MPDRGLGIFGGAPKILGRERGLTKNRISEKGGHGNYKANMSYLKRKPLPSTIFVKPHISPRSIINEYFREPLGTTILLKEFLCSICVTCYPKI